ncbi:MAG: fibronectin type III domain-containing protein [Treponema sp.]
MKKNWKAAFALITMACILSAGILSCKTEVDSDTTAPAEATSFTAQAGDSQAILSWTNPTDADFYGVEVSATPATGTLANPVVLTGTTSSLTVTGLANATKYTFTVKTMDKSLNTSTGTTATATPADSSDKTAPAEVTGIAATAGDSQALLSWTNPTDADFYGVEVSATPAYGSLATPVVLIGKITTVSVSGLANGTEYTFIVRTIDKSLNKSTGTTAKATPVNSTDSTAPAEVTKLAKTEFDSSILLSWTNPTDSDFYGVTITQSPATVTLANSVTLLNGTSTFTASGLTNGTTYTFTLKTFDLNNNKSAGTKISATPVDSSDKTAPLDVTDLAAVNKDASVLLTWTDNSTDSDIYGYQVSWDKSGSINRSATSTAVASGTMIVAPGNGGCYVSNLTNGTEYTFTVKSVDTSGNKSTGTSKTITPCEIDKTAPDAVTNLTASYDYNSKQIKVTWTDPGDSDLVNIVFSYEIGSADAITQNVVAGTQSYTIAVDDSYLTNTTYTIKAKAADATGNKSVEATTSVTTSSVPSISSITLDRNHISSSDSNRNITVTVTGSNFSTIAYQPDATLLIQ